MFFESCVIIEHIHGIFPHYKSEGCGSVIQTCIMCMADFNYLIDPMKVWTLNMIIDKKLLDFQTGIFRIGKYYSILVIKRAYLPIYKLTDTTFQSTEPDLFRYT